MKPAVVLFVLLLAPATFAQTLEYGRDSAGILDMTTKQNMPFHGSFSLNSGRGLGATFGGTVVKDRVWFFASGDRTRDVFRTSAPMTKSDINASFVTTRAPQTLTLPKSFLSLHSTSVLSPNSFVSVDVQQSRH